VSSQDQSFREWLRRFADDDSKTGALAREIDGGQYAGAGRWPLSRYLDSLTANDASPETTRTFMAAWCLYSDERDGYGRPGDGQPSLKEPTAGTQLMSESEFIGAVRQLAIRRGLRCGPASALGWRRVNGQ
jgi:hypothetical protein